MRNFFAGLLIIASSLFTTKVFAAQKTVAAIPQNLHIFSTSGVAYVTTVAQGCSHKAMYQLHPSHRAYSEIYKTLLAAQIAGKKVVIRFDRCVNGTTNPRGNIVGVYLRD